MESKKTKLATNKKVAEAQIERYLVSEIKRIGGLCWKWTSPGTNGVPDRIIMIQGLTIAVELKAPGEEVRPLQQHRIDEIKLTGNMACVVDSYEVVDKLIRNLENGRILNMHVGRLCAGHQYDL